MGTLNRGGLIAAITNSFGTLPLPGEVAGNKDFRKFKRGKRTRKVHYRSACGHSKRSYVCAVNKGHQFKCRSCNMPLVVRKGDLLRPYSQNRYSNRFYDGEQEHAPNFLNPPYRPSK